MFYGDAPTPLDPQLSAEELRQLAADPAMHAQIARHPHAPEDVLREIADTSEDRGARAAARAALAPPQGGLPDWQKFLLIVAVLAIIGGIFAMIVILTGDDEAAASAVRGLLDVTLGAS